MHAALAAVARRYGLSPAAIAELASAEAQIARDAAGAPSAATGTPGSALIAGRYLDLGPIGSGGMGEVRRVRDVALNRVLAMKVAHSALLSRPATLARFLEEAQATSQLQHPNIVPVHDLGRLADGRLWFTMKEVDGRSLTEVIREVHAASFDRWETVTLPTAAGASGGTSWSLRRLVSAFLVACQAVAYAHERGVVHRDLKPDHVMLGRHGEVYVLDWGLAKILGQPVSTPPGGAEERVASSRAADHATRFGQVAGTPAYMPPEQARGENDRIDQRSDVYALGAVLYEILSGRPPYSGSGASALARVLAGPPPPVGRITAAPTLSPWLDADDDDPPAGPPLPAELVAACERAMSRDPVDRFATASELADAVLAWLDGSKRREQALAVVAEADAIAEACRALDATSSALEAEAAALLAGVAKWEAEERTRPGWAKADAAAAVAQSARLRQVAVDETLKAAFQFVPDLPEAHARLVERYQARFDAAERARDHVGAAEARVLLASHLGALPESSPVRQAAAVWLRGDGALTLVTDPPGAEVHLYRCEESQRRSVQVFERVLGVTPLRAAPLPMGSYLCVLRHPDRAEVRYPVSIARGAHWDGAPPGGGGPAPVALPRRDALGGDDVYVPAGWFASGGDPLAARGLPASARWVEAFVVRRFPVTNREYLAFLDDLVATGRTDEALRHSPRERGAGGAPGPVLLAFDGRRFALQPDPDGDMWDLDWPVGLVDWAGAAAYAAWEAARTGQPWRLVGELEREKAARGVDGRWFPWGDRFDPAWACSRDSHGGQMLPSRVDGYPVDVSVYGVRGLGGNMRDWCGDVGAPDGGWGVGDRVAGPWPGDGEPVTNRVYRGGSWLYDPALARAASRNRHSPDLRDYDVGLRLARTLG
jgi:serine/threonine protein kinase/formylglycine-generating enzyme required for sulfatase activity